MIETAGGEIGSPPAFTLVAVARRTVRMKRLRAGGHIGRRCTRITHVFSKQETGKQRQGCHSRKHELRLRSDYTRRWQPALPRAYKHDRVTVCTATLDD